MRISIREISIETEDATQAATLISAWRNGTAHPEPTKPKKIHQPKEEVLALPPASAPPDVYLSRQLTETWEWLVAHDTRAGRSIDEIAAGLDITNFTASYRLTALVKKGLAHRVKPGRYRRGEK